MQPSTAVLTALLLAMTVAGLPWDNKPMDHYPIIKEKIIEKKILPVKEKLIIEKEKIKLAPKLIEKNIIEKKVDGQPLKGTCKEVGGCKAIGHKDCPTGSYYHGSAGKCVAGNSDHLDCREGFSYSHAHNACVHKRSLEDGTEEVVVQE